MFDPLRQIWCRYTNCVAQICVHKSQRKLCSDIEFVSDFNQIAIYSKIMSFYFFEKNACMALNIYI